MKAFTCDCCARLAPLEEVLQLVVTLPSHPDEDGSEHPTEWQMVDVCQRCLKRKPMLEVLSETCIGLLTAWEDRLRGPMEEQAAEPAEDS